MSSSCIASSTSSDSSTVDVAITASGGSAVPKAVYRGGALVGMNSSTERPPVELPVDFLDWPFLEDEEDEVAWRRHLNLARREQPEIAVAPDVTGERGLEAVLDKADQLATHASTVIVVPKAVSPRQVPDRFRIGLPAQDSYGNVPWPMWEYQQCDSVHLLGGGPQRQQKLAQYVPVESVDTSAPVKAAMFGDVWDGSWREAGNGYYDRIERSAEHLSDWWGALDADEVNCRRLQIEPPTGCYRPFERKTKPRSRDQLVLGSDDKRPFPGRAYFYRRDTLSHREYCKHYIEE